MPKPQSIRERLAVLEHKIDHMAMDVSEIKNELVQKVSRVEGRIWAAMMLGISSLLGLVAALLLKLY